MILDDAEVAYQRRSAIELAQEMVIQIFRIKTDHNECPKNPTPEEILSIAQKYLEFVSNPAGNLSTIIDKALAMPVISIDDVGIIPVDQSILDTFSLDTVDIL